MKRHLITGLLAVLIAIPAEAQNGPQTRCTTVSPTVTAGAYTSGQDMGGLLTFTNALRSSSRAGLVTAVNVVDLAAQTADLELVLFNDNPSGSTFTDNATLTIAAADIPKIAAVVSLSTSSRFSWGSLRGVKYLGSLSLPVQGGQSTGTSSPTLYGALVSRGTPTQASTSDIKVTVCISQD